MALQLTIIRSPDGVVVKDTSKTFAETGGSIGRGDSNSWVLMDPERFLSSCHCEISFEAGQYYLVDTSTNGTFLNDEQEPIGKGARTLVRDGDSFDIGDYRFSMSLQAAGVAPAVASPFAELESPFIDDSLVSDSPFAASADIFGGGPSLSLSPEAEETDPLAALDKAGAGGADPFAAVAANHSFAGVPEFDDDLGFNEQVKPAQSFATQQDGGDALNQAISWPSASPSAIPEDWDEDDLLGSSAPIPPTHSTAQIPPQEFKSAQVKPEASSFAGKAKRETSQRPGGRSDSLLGGEGDVAPVRAPRPARASRSDVAARATATSSARTSDVGSKANVRAEPSPQGSPQRNNDDAVSLLIRNMGLGEDLSTAQVEDVAAVVGRLIPEIVEGMMGVLRSRASIKNEFRMNITTIQPVENNPLKFSVDAQEAIENMFVRKRGAYKAPSEAFREGFDGIAEHQVAILAGIRAAFKNMMDRFNPENLEKQFDRNSKGAILPGMQKARYWSSYHDFYKNYVDNMEHSFHHLFGDEFVQAYEDQLRKLSAERKRARASASAADDEI